MSGLPTTLVTPVAGGEFTCGIVLVMSTVGILRHGVFFALKNDHKRQVLLNLICFICGINGSISYGFNATKASLVVSNVTTVITFLCVQFSLVIINHNTIIRAASLFLRVSPKKRKFVENACMVLYVLPFLVLIPIYYAFIDTVPKNVAVNTSTFNSLIYKPLNIGLIIVTEALATLTDVVLLREMRKERILQSSRSIGATEKTLISPRLMKDLTISYSIIWGIVVADITIKGLIYSGFPLLFDSIITILAVTMRAHVNLLHGILLKSTSHHYQGQEST